jgi:hypothetical protein
LCTVTHKLISYPMKPIPNMNECVVNSGYHSSYHFPARKLAIKFPEVLKGYTIRRNIHSWAHYLKIISIIHNQAERFITNCL